MPAWLTQNIGTILIIAALAAFFALLIWSLIRDKKKGKSSCGGCCSSCTMGCHYRPADPQPTDISEADDTPKAEKGVTQ